MAWQKCKRCGSNRVISKSFGLGNIISVGVMISIIVFAWYVIKQMASPLLNGLESFEKAALIIMIPAFAIMSMGSLYCKDCELTFKPEKDLHKINVKK